MPSQKGPRARQAPLERESPGTSTTTRAVRSTGVAAESGVWLATQRSTFVRLIVGVGLRQRATDGPASGGRSSSSKEGRPAHRRRGAGRLARSSRRNPLRAASRDLTSAGQRAFWSPSRNSPLLLNPPTHVGNPPSSQILTPAADARWAARREEERCMQEGTGILGRRTRRPTTTSDRGDGGWRWRTGLVLPTRAWMTGQFGPQAAGRRHREEIFDFPSPLCLDPVPPPRRHRLSRELRASSDRLLPSRGSEGPIPSSPCACPGIFGSSSTRASSVPATPSPSDPAPRLLASLWRLAAAGGRSCAHSGAVASAAVARSSWRSNSSSARSR